MTKQEFNWKTFILDIFMILAFFVLGTYGYYEHKLFYGFLALIPIWCAVRNWKVLK